MAETELYLDNQSNRTLSDPRLQTQVRLRDPLAVRSTIIDWDEPAGVDRVVTIPDPTVDTEIVLADTQQTLANKKYTGPIVAVDDMVNKAYVDATTGGADATSGIGGGTKGIATYDESFGLTIAGGAACIARVKTDGTTTTFDGSGNVKALAGSVPAATSAPGGGALGRVTADTNLGMEIVGIGIMKPKVDGATVIINGSGELQAISGATLVSTGIPFTSDIPLVTAATDVLIGTDIDALRFPKGSTTGTKLDWTVPDDYTNGNIEVLVVYKMTSASAFNQLRLSSQVVIVDAVNGVIDSATYPDTPFNFTTLVTANIVRSLFMTIVAGDFSAGDQLQVRFKRIGADVNDLHPGDLDVVTFEVRYNASGASRMAVAYVDLFSDALAENPTTDTTIGTDVDVTVFATGADSAVKFQVAVPDHWDEVTDASIRAVYAMSSAVAGQTVRLETSAEVCDIVVGTIATIAAQNYDFSPTNDINPHRTTVIRDLQATSLRRGDVIKIKLARRVGVGSNHPGSFQLVGVTDTFSVTDGGAVTTTLVTEQFLTEGVFGNPSGPGVSGDTDVADLVEFEIFDHVLSTVLLGTLDTSYEGRLSSAQSQVSSIKVNIKGTGATPRYRLRVYAEGTGQVYDSGVLPAMPVTTTTSLTAVDLSAQPAGAQKRYFVIIQALLDIGEALFISRPYTRQE